MKKRTILSWIFTTLWFLCCTLSAQAQSNCFTYEDDVDETIIMGLTDEGLAATSLTIPAKVTIVRSGAFNDLYAQMTSLIIDGGNPTFEGSLFGSLTNPLVTIETGISMSVANITALIASLGSQGALSTIDIAGYTGTWVDIALLDVLTEDVNVILPAAIVSNQQFGNAKVYGRFQITKEIVSFCGNATFYDENAGGNTLFYVADKYEQEQSIHIRRVRYVAKGKGVLIHREDSGAGYVELPRVGDDDYEATEKDLYDNNLLVGVTEPTRIGGTDGDKTNLILSNGAFHPTSGGTIGANKAYLQVPTSWAAREGWVINFADETTAISSLPKEEGVTTTQPCYNLQGQRIQPSATKGLYIMNGRTYRKH